MKKFAKILVPTDFSEAADRALEYAFTFASAMGLEINILHVIDSRVGQAMVYSHRLRDDDKAMEQASHEEIQDEVKKVLELEMKKGMTYDSKLKVTTKVRHGIPYEQIVKVAEKDKVDFIVMGARGYSAVEGLFIGGVAEKVSRRASCPVFLSRRRRRG